MSVLLADIGGTNLRFTFLNDTNISPLQYYKTSDFSTLSDVLDIYLSQEKIKPSKMIFGVAGIIQNKKSKLTNADFQIDVSELEQKYPDTKILLVNDFVLQGYGILSADKKDLYPLTDKQNETIGPKLVLGPGTGLGSCFLFPNEEDNYTVLSSEAGHTSLAAITPNQQKILAEITKDESPISFEDILSGSGLLRLYQAILKINQQAPDADWLSEKEEMKKNFNAEKTIEADFFPLRPMEVTLLAQKNDEAALLSFWYFFEFLGIYASNLALTLKTTGGIYFVGNLLNQPVIQDFLLKSYIKKYFYHKGVFSSYLKEIPIFLVKQPDIQINGLIYLSKNV